MDTRRIKSPAGTICHLPAPDCGRPSGRETNANDHIPSGNESLSSPLLPRSEVDLLQRQKRDGGRNLDHLRRSGFGRRIYFVSSRTGFFNVWGIDFDPATGEPRGEPFRVTNFESPSRMILPEVSVMEMALAADRIVLPIMEVSGGIWILENVGR